jgi:hypothetical protein
MRHALHKLLDGGLSLFKQYFIESVVYPLFMILDTLKMTMKG